MKIFISLFVITLIAAISWSSCANNKADNVVTIYSLSYPIAEYSLLSPLLTEQETNDSLHFSPTEVVKGHNRFFELSIVFNDKLQQLISKFNRSDNTRSDIVNNNLPSYNQNQSTVEACKTNT